MEIAALRAFVAVAEHASFTRAAKQLFLTQPAISKRISALEDDLNTRLFDRVSPQVQLTEAGRTLLDSARRILGEVANAVDEIQSLDKEVGGKLRIGTSHHVGIHRLPPVLRAYTSTYSRVELDLRFMDSELACEQVENGQLELAVVTLPQAVPDNLIATLIWDDPLAIVVPHNHPLASGKRVDPRQLASYPAILPAVGTITRSILETSLAPFSVVIDVALETNYLETIKMMVSVGLGWSVLPENMLNSETLSIPVRGLTMRRSLGAVRLKNRSLSRAAASFLQVLETRR